MKDGIGQGLWFVGVLVVHLLILTGIDYDTTPQMLACSQITSAYETFHPIPSLCSGMIRKIALGLEHVGKS